MKKILLLSDTHGSVELDILKYFENVDEIWHAGDWGNVELSDIIEGTGKMVRSVWGNIDGTEIRARYPEHSRFNCEGVDVWMTHIGGFPEHYPFKLQRELKVNPPALFICGHSHILRVMRDKKINNMLVMNPGAAGRHGFHNMRTMLQFEIDKGKMLNVAVIELGKRTSGLLPEK